jgi:rare lipoprotein A
MKPLLTLSVLALSACASAPIPWEQSRPSSGSGGYYKDDGPGERPPANLDQIADAQPRAEPLHRYANRPYQVFGKEYVPLASVQPYRQRGMASWYGKKFHGQRTASGETYDMYAMSAAHTTLPIPSYARVTRVATGRSVIVRINDRGPFHPGRMIDLSYAAALKLGFAHLGSAEVELESIEPGQAVTPTQQAATTAPPAVAPTPPPAAPTQAATTTQQAAATTQQAAATTPQAATTTPLAAATTLLAAATTPLAAATTPPAAAPTPLAAAPTEQAAAPTPPAATTTEQALPAPEQAAAVYVQVGAFSSRDNAENLRSRLEDEFGWLKNTVQVLAIGNLWRLHLGPYRTHNDARSVAERIESQLSIKPLLVVR